ncbi:MAG: hypothetical protein ACERIH_08390 [Labilibaculum antarcticum]
MKKFIYLFIGLGLSFNICCANNDYIAYHQKSNKAKVLIAQSKFECALDIYIEIFKEYPKHFYKDVHNACVCAIRCEKFSNANLLASELVLLGYKLEDFQQVAFNAFRNTDKWNSFCKTYPKLRKDYESTLNMDLREKYYQLFLDDQLVASRDEGYGNLKNDSSFFALTKHLKEFYESDGIPNYLHNKDTLNIKYFILYRHYFGMKNNADNKPDIKNKSDLYEKIDALNWKKVLLNELQQGNIDPQFYSDAIIYNDFSDPYGKTAVKIDFEKEKVMLFMNLKSDEIAVKNENREAIGLLPLNESNSDILGITWYAKYPFRQIKDSLVLLTSPNPMVKLKVIRKFESKIRDYYQNTDLNDFFLGDYNQIKEAHFFGLDL